VTPQEIRDKLARELKLELEWHEGDKGVGDPWATVPAESWIKACQTARQDDELAFDFLRSLSGVDRPDDQKIEVVVHLFSYEKKHAFVLKTQTDRNNPQVDSLVEVWPAANWYERECFDLLGVVFEGHPDLRRILLPEDWQGYPLRKDYRQKDDYRGIPTTRPGYEKGEDSQ